MSFPNIEVTVIKDGQLYFPFYYSTDAYYATGGKVTTINSGSIVELKENPVFPAIPTVSPIFPGLIPTVVATNIKTIDGADLWLNCTSAQLISIIRAAS